MNLYNRLDSVKNNTSELAAIAFDLGSLDKVAELAVETAGILASATVEGDYSAAKKIRDQAFTYLKIVVDEVCSFGQYLFWKDEARKRGYSSSYLRRVRRKRMKENEDEVQGPADAGGDADM